MRICQGNFKIWSEIDMDGVAERYREQEIRSEKDMQVERYGVKERYGERKSKRLVQVIVLNQFLC